MLARLLGAHEVGLIAASFASHSARAQQGVVARKVDPQILAEWSILWPTRAKSAAIEQFLDGARQCAASNEWLPTTETTSGAKADSRTTTPP